MKPGRIHHIEIYVSNLHKSADFWGWFLGLLGYAPYQKWDGGQSWKLDDMEYVVIAQTEKKFLGIPFHRKRVGLNHLAFCAASRAQVDEVTNLLRERGHKILYAEKHPFAGAPDYYALFFEDPDRIKVELVAPD